MRGDGDPRHPLHLGHQEDESLSTLWYWKSEGHVMLEYGCPVWHSGLTVSQSHSLDQAQRVAMAAITGQWEPSHTRQLEDLGLERLSTRRTRLCEQFARRTATNSRHMDLFTPVDSLQRRAKNSKKYRDIPTRTHISTWFFHT